jgi:hypothetical protein
VDQNEKETLCYFNSNDQIEKIIASNGVELYLNWLNTSEFTLTAISANKSIQLNTVGNLDLAAKGKKSSISRKGKLKLQVQGPPAKFISQNEFTTKLNDQNAFNYLTVEECGPFNPSSVVITMKDADRKVLATIFPDNIALGKYQYSVPHSNLPSVNFQDACKATANVIDVICKSTDVFSRGFICALISATLATTVVGAPAAALFLVACEEANLALAFFCKLPDLQTCKGKLFTTDFNTTSKIIFNVYTPGLLNNLESPDVIVPLPLAGTYIGPFPDLYVKLASVVNIKKFNLEPSIPLAGNDYAAEVEVSCLTIGTTIKISVAGSDGYYDEILYNVTTSASLDTFVLTVPGAESGVKDVCTVTVKTLGLNEISRSAYLVFN